MKTVTGFDKAKVKLIGVNQGEPPAQVARFLKQRSWSLQTVMDREQKIGGSYGVEGIPHTVLIGPDGKVVWTTTGYHSGEGEELAEEIRKVLK